MPGAHGLSQAPPSGLRGFSGTPGAPWTVFCWELRDRHGTPWIAEKHPGPWAAALGAARCLQVG
eukprot:4631217-Pyramimonas_sp.AAC.1